MWLLKKLFKKRDEQLVGDGDVVKPFLDHLEDLRWTIMKMVATLAISMVLAFCFRTSLTALLNHPLQVAVPGAKLIMIDPIESVSMSVMLSFYSGIIVAFPFLFYFLAEFLLPALTKKEKRYVLPAVGVGFGLFLLGVLISYFLVLPPTLRWLNGDAKSLGIDATWTAKNYYGFVTHMSIAVGLILEMPVVMATLSGIGLISYQWLKGMRMYGYAIALILAGIISPTPDLFMLLIFAVPVMSLFELCIWLVWFMERRRAKAEASEAQAERPSAPAPVPVTETYPHEDPHHGYYDEHHHGHDPYHDEHGNYIGEHDHSHDDFHPGSEPHAGEGDTGEAASTTPALPGPVAAGEQAYVPPLCLMLPPL